MPRPRFRDSFPLFGPAWLTRGEGGSVLYSLSLLMDGMAERFRQGLRARYPEHGTPTALARLGQDRRIVRGRNESDAVYAARLTRFREDWRAAGIPYALMEQVQAYLAPHKPRIRLVSNRGDWFTLESDGTRTHKLQAGNWNWDGNTALRSRFWLIIYTSDSLWIEEGPWGDGASTWGEAGTTGTTATAEQIATINQILGPWKNGASVALYVIIALSDALFDPDAAPGAPMPDGTWGQWSKGGAGPRVRARSSSARYWEVP